MIATPEKICNSRFHEIIIDPFKSFINKLFVFTGYMPPFDESEIVRMANTSVSSFLDKYN